MFDLNGYIHTQSVHASSVGVKPVSPVSLPDKSCSSQSEENHSPGTPISTRVQNVMMQYQDYNQHHSRSADVSPTVVGSGHNHLDCPKVWERIVSHPRFDEVDIEALCAELNARVRIVPPPPLPRSFWKTELIIVCGERRT
jgi:hypothetical protein